MTQKLENIPLALANLLRPQGSMVRAHGSVLKSDQQDAVWRCVLIPGALAAPGIFSMATP